MNKPSAPIIDALGSDLIEAEIGVSSHSVRYAKTTGLFPASWFDRVDMLCTEKGIACPREAFNWKSIADDKGAAAIHQKQNERKGPLL